MKIVSITPIIDNQDYFDITVEESHNFLLSNGSVVHNCGTGLGFSVERQFIAELPSVSDDFHPTDTVITVRDSKIGWATAYREMISLLYTGQIPKWDVSKVRPSGARLKTFGGRASGPKPLEDLFRFSIDTFRKAAGRKLNSVECHDLICKVADIVVVGGVRRSALISLSNLSDDRMRIAKSGQWWESNPQRALANNSASYTEKPDIELFMKEWLSLIESKSGERGIFNRVSAKKKAAESGRRDISYDFGTNPCGEILLRSCGLCNLTEVVIRAEDTLETLMAKVEAATIMGTYQSMMTNYRYVRPIWKKNAEEERLLGVSMTGIMDHPVLSRATAQAAEWLQKLKDRTIAVNAEWAAKLGINQSVAITTVKPSGTVSQLVDSASGIHPRYAKFYARTVRADKKDPLAIMMREMGFPVEDDFMKPTTGDVFYFPVKGPEAGVFRNDMTAIEQLEHYLMFKEIWCEHNPSITVYVRNDEWLEVGSWVYKHFDSIGGVSFLPHSEHSYTQPPYGEIDEKAYEELLARMPDADWADLKKFEKQDTTTSAKEYACSSGHCEIL